MPNKLYISNLLPVKFNELNPVAIPQYLSQFFDYVPFENTIEDWEQHMCFYQPFQTSDLIHLQVQSNYAPLQVKIIDKQGKVYNTIALTQQLQNVLEPDMYIYQASIDISALTDGIYFLKFEAGATPFILISEPLYIKQTHLNTLLLEYHNNRLFGDVIFETGYLPSIRVPGKIKYKQPAAKDTFYEDQELNMTLLNSVPFKTWDLILGSSIGLPDYLIDKLNWVLGCSTILIDGRHFTKNEGAKFEEKSLEDYPLRGWSIEMRESRNRGRQSFENNNPNHGPNDFIVSVDSKGFGIDTNGGTEYNIIDVI